MSQSLAAAKKRRASIALNEISQPSSPNIQNIVPNMQRGLTLPQVIQIVDRRLIILEKFMNDSKSNSGMSSPINMQSDEGIETPANLKEIIEEFDKRYEMLAEEIVNIKNIVLSLQSYTMDVNKMLLEERNRIFSEIEGSQESPEQKNE